MFFLRLHFPNNECMSTELVAVLSQKWLSTHRSHTFSGTVHYGEEPWGGRWLSLSQLCRRFTRVMVTRLSIKCHCEMYLTPSLESVLQGLINVRLMDRSPNIMKYCPDHHLLLPLFKMTVAPEIWLTLSAWGHATLRMCELTRRMRVPRSLSL